MKKKSIEKGMERTKERYSSDNKDISIIEHMCLISKYTHVNI